MTLVIATSIFPCEALSGPDGAFSIPSRNRSTLVRMVGGLEKEATTAASSLARKLRIRPGNRVLVLNAAGNSSDFLGEMPEGVAATNTPGKEFNIVLAFFTHKADLDSRVEALKVAIGADGILWVAYPKGSSKVATDLNRDILRNHLLTVGLEGVALVAVDDTWSAMRLKKLYRA